jgi:DNA-binding NtrC family response regulator
MQIRINRIIQSKEFYRESSTKIRPIDIRVIAASSQDLTLEDEGASFSPELLHHLMMHSIRLPALRDRPDDIPLLAERFVSDQAKSAGRSIRQIDEELIELLCQYEFRGNVRELRDIMAMAVQNTEGDTVSLDTLSPYMREILIAGRTAKSDFRIRPLREVEREHVLRTLQVLGGDRKMAALALGITEEALESMLPSG